MNALQRFLRRQAKRAAKVPTLDQALLTDRPWAYARYRLRYTFPRALLRTVLHAVEITLFARVIFPEILVYFLVVRSATALFGGLWWGALETLREDVRQLPAAQRATQLPHLVQGWLGLAGMASVLQVVALLAWLAWGPSPFESFSVLDAYAIACVCVSVTRTLATTYHAGIFALRRVHRPPWAILGPDVLELGAVLTLYAWLGAWSFALALLTMGWLRAGLRVMLSRRAYHQSGYALMPWRVWARSVRRLAPRAKATSLAAVANLATQLDAWLILGLAASASAGRGALALAATLHVLRPLLAAGADWARLFYFDFARLALRYSGLLQARFSRFAERLSWAVAAITGTLGLAVLGVLHGRLGEPLVLVALGCFVAARARFSLSQVQAFAYARRARLTKVTLVLMGAAAIAAWLPVERPLWLIGVSLCFLLAAGWLSRAARVQASPYRLAAAAGPRRIPLARWLQELSQATHPVSLWVARVDTKASSVPRVLAALGEVHEGACFTRIGRRRIAWWREGLQGETGERERRTWIETAGCLRELQWLEAPEGLAALRQVLERHWLGARLAGQLDGPPVDEAALLEGFAARFPQGWVLDARGGGRPPKLKSPRAASRLRRALDRVAADGPASRREEGIPDVSVYCPGGEPEIVFMSGPNASAEQRAEWADLVKTASLRASLVRPTTRRRA